MKSKNVFNDVPADIPEEIFSEIFKAGTVRIERIVSKGHSSPQDFWYDQDEGEWVLLLRGKAKLKFYDDSAPLELKTGDYINIPAHKKHRVEWTDSDMETIWLAVFY